MRTLFLTLLILLGVVVGIGFVSAEYIDQFVLEYSGYPDTMMLEKGWNLIPTVALPHTSSETVPPGNKQDLDRQGIRAVFLYDRYNNRYIQSYPSYDKAKMEQLARQIGDWANGGDVGEYGGYVNSAKWVYADKGSSIMLGAGDWPLSLRYVNLRRGWNFLIVTPEFDTDRDNEFTWDELKSSCTIEKVYFYAAQSQEWYRAGLNDKVELDDVLWKGFVIKVANDCTLASPTSNSAPPSLPEETQQTEPIAEKCVFSGGVACEDVAVTSASKEVKFLLQNGVGSPIVLTDYHFEASGDCTGTPSVLFGTPGTTQKDVQNGEQVLVTVTCGDAIQKGKFESTFTLHYTNTLNGITHPTTGTIVSNVQ